MRDSERVDLLLDEIARLRAVVFSLEEELLYWLERLFREDQVHE